MAILAIETSCDETAVAIVKDGGQVLANVIASQIDLHQATGGVVPEVASREHVRQLPWIYKQAFLEAKLGWEEIEAIAVTETPGLIGSLLVGIQTGRTLASIHHKPYLPVNHIRGHIYSNWLERQTSEMQFPIIALTVSGGHTNIYLIEGPGREELLGTTQDDAAGEAFDKVAKLIGLPYPGGPAISQLANQGDENAYQLPIAKLDEPYNFSFSGLKTAVLYLVRELASKHDCQPNELPKNIKADIAASFQKTAVNTLVQAVARAVSAYQPQQIHLAGGVSANKALRSAFTKEFTGQTVLWPKQMSYCTDNAAMIAAAAYYPSANKA